MARGRKADPQALQAAKGNPGRRARAEDPPAVEARPARMTAPACLDPEDMREVLRTYQGACTAVDTIPKRVDPALPLDVGLIS